MPRLIPPQFGNGWRPGDSFHRPGTVAVLDVSDETHDLVAKMHDAALDSDDDAELLTGTIVMIDCPRFVDGSKPGPMTCHVGASTLHEAATEVVTAHAQLASEMPSWVAATDEQLAEVVAEHFTVDGYSSCKVIAMNKITQRSDDL